MSVNGGKGFLLWKMLAMGNHKPGVEKANDRQIETSGYRKANRSQWYRTLERKIIVELCRSAVQHDSH
jgi:hypothetical protein